VTIRQLSSIDNLIVEFDKALTTVLGQPTTTGREDPDKLILEHSLSEKERKLSVALMRVNHAGEVSAQALYQGQALTAELPDIKSAMQQAALEENDHLIWCKKRITNLGGNTSMLTPLWYAGSFTIGALAGKVGDKWSLGFVAETEKQVAEHLDDHLSKISLNDKKSRAIIEQMKVDELHHGSAAKKAGGAPLPHFVKATMGIVSKIMTLSSHQI
jgi:ubiquinone biosynthesis monooxygenase Coq7